MTRSQVEEMRIKLNEALSFLNDEGFEFQIGTIHFDSAGMNTKLSLVQLGGNVNSIEKAEWDKYCHKYGFSKGDFGRRFHKNTGETFEITGLQPRGRKYHIIAKNIDNGKYYKFPKTTVHMYLKNGIEREKAVDLLKGVKDGE